LVSWSYDHKTEKNSPEDELLSKFIVIQEWL